VNGKPLDDFLHSEIRHNMKVAISKPKVDTDENIRIVAARDSYHEVVEFLEGLAWDGEDHIAKLAGYITEKDTGWFETSFTHWIVGACAKALHTARMGVQNFMLVLEGPQGIGKSYLVQWLSEPLGYKYFIEGPLATTDKDTQVRLLRKFVWEVSELGATIRKQDVEALKAVISQLKVTVRRAYGKFDMEGPVLCSLVGTVNDSTGLLSDVTGNRRFAINAIRKIDFSYAEDLQAEQIWAQAVQLYKAGVPWELEQDESVRRDEINVDFMIDDPLEGWIRILYRIDPEEYADEFTASDVIVSQLKEKNVRFPNHGQYYTFLARTMKLLGCPRARVRDKGEQRRGYLGLKRRPVTD
jgi:predicted P-loop ATPase